MKTIITMLFLAAIPFFVIGQSVTNNSVSNLSYTSVTLSANGLTLDPAKTYKVDFYYATSSGGYSSSLVSSNQSTGSSSLVFNANLSGLTESTTYYITAVLYEKSGLWNWIYVDDAPEYSFTTLAPSVPTVSLGTAFGSITATSANNTGNIIVSENGSSITDKGIVYGVTPMPTSSTGTLSSQGDGSGSYTGYINGLTQLTKYYARAYALNAVDYGYSATEEVFTTLATNEAEIIDMTSYAANELTITYTGGSGDGCIIYMRANDQVVDPSNGTSYTANTTFGSGSDIGSGTYVVYYGAASKASVTVTNLNPSNDYYVRIATYSTNAGGPYFDANDQGMNTADDSNLPVTLVAFAASSADNAVRLSWTTASEINNHFFAIEKSVDGLFFNEIGKMDGAGTSNMLNNYSFLDNEVSGERVFYRLRQVDFDGAESFSSVITVDTEKLGPAIDYLYADDNGLSIIATTASANTQMIITDMNGKIVRNQNLSGSNSHQLRISTVNMPAGVYMLTLNDGINKLTKKFVL